MSMFLKLWDLQKVVECVFGSSDWMNSEDEHFSEKIINLFSVLSQQLAAGSIVCYGAKINAVDIVTGLCVNRVEIPKEYWEKHTLDELSFFACGAGETRHFLEKKSDIPKRGDYNFLKFNAWRIVLLKRKLQKESKVKKCFIPNYILSSLNEWSVEA